MEHNWIICTVVCCSIALFSQIVAGTHRKVSDGDYAEKALEFPETLKHLQGILNIPFFEENILQFYAPINSVSKRCQNDSKVYLEALKDFSPWAVQMMDSSSKLPSGFMAGHVQDLGNFDECLLVDSKAPVSTQYCMVEFHGILPKTRKKYEDVDTVNSGIPILEQNLPQLSICIPASCDVQDIIVHYTEFVSRWNGTAFVDRYSCTTKENKPPDAVDWFAAVYLTLLIAITIASTTYELVYGQQYKNDTNPPFQHRMLTVFSLYKNGKQLLKMKDPKHSLSIINGLRVVSIIWILVGHHVVLRTFAPAVNYLYFFKTISDLKMSWILNAILGVDTFLLISGFLLSYIFLKEFSSEKKKFNFSLYFLHRYIRVTPVYLSALLIAATWYVRIGDGPLWKTLVQRHTEYCRNNWWTNLLYINNYVEADRQCASFSWYLCVDMHLYLLSPLILLPLIKYRRFGITGLPIILLMSVVIPFFVAYVYELPAASLFTRDLRSARNYSIEYTPTHNRAGPWIVGMILGYILHTLRDKKVNLSKLTVMCGWIISLVLCLGTIYSISYFHQNDFIYDRLESSLYIGLNRTVWAFGVAWIIFACETGYGGPVRKILSWRGFQPLGRLTFCIYFIHASIQYAFIGSTRSPTYFSNIFLTRDIMGEFLMVICQAAALSLIIEVPFMNIEKLLLRRGTKEKSENVASKCKGNCITTPGKYKQKPDATRF